MSPGSTDRTEPHSGRGRHRGQVDGQRSVCRYWRHSSSVKLAGQLPGGDVDQVVDVKRPDPHEAVLAGGDEFGAVGTERERGHRPSVTREHQLLLARGHVPDPHRAVDAARRELRPVRAEGRGDHVGAVARQAAQVLAGREVPHVDHVRTDILDRPGGRRQGHHELTVGAQPPPGSRPFRSSGRPLPLASPRSWRCRRTAPRPDPPTVPRGAAHRQA